MANPHYGVLFAQQTRVDRAGSRYPQAVRMTDAGTEPERSAHHRTGRKVAYGAGGGHGGRYQPVFARGNEGGFDPSPDELRDAC